MKKLLLITLLAFSFGVNAQYYSVTYINVSQEDVAEVGRLESQYWSKVAKENIDNGKQAAWGLVAAVGGTPNGWTHAFVNVYETADQAADQSIWNPEAILGISSSEISTGHLTDGGFSFQNWAVQTSIGGERTPGSVQFGILLGQKI